MWGFQIWPQNSNRIKFDPLFGQKMYFKGVKSDILPTSTVFGQKGVKCYLILILRPYLESSHHFAYTVPLSIWHSHFFYLLFILKKKIIFATPKKVANHQKNYGGLQIWPQNSKWITFDPCLVKKLLQVGKITDLADFNSFFFGGKGSNVILIEFWGQIWNPLIILHILEPPFDVIFAFLLFDPMH